MPAALRGAVAIAAAVRHLSDEASSVKQVCPTVWNGLLCWNEGYMPYDLLCAFVPVAFWVLHGADRGI